MSKNILQPLLDLARAAEAAEALANQAKELSAEVERAKKNLADLRSQEAAAGSSRTTAKEEADRILGQAKDASARLLRENDAKLAAQIAEAEKQLADMAKAEKAQVDKYKAEAAWLTTSIAALTKQESTLGQQVAAHRAGLDAIRAKLG
jgi:chromosome segregation ATPase